VIRGISPEVLKIFSELKICVQLPATNLKSSMKCIIFSKQRLLKLIPKVERLTDEMNK
jgi:hypothetical protein